VVYHKLVRIRDHLCTGNAGTVMSEPQTPQTQQESLLYNLLFGAPLTARADAAEACAELDLALGTARAQLKAVFGPEENESANQVELEVG
jgi:hypothetical protein